MIEAKRGGREKMRDLDIILTTNPLGYTYVNKLTLSDPSIRITIICWLWPVTLMIYCCMRLSVLMKTHYRLKVRGLLRTQAKGHHSWSCTCTSSRHYQPSIKTGCVTEGGLNVPTIAIKKHYGPLNIYTKFCYETLDGAADGSIMQTAGNHIFNYTAQADWFSLHL